MNIRWNRLHSLLTVVLLLTLATVRASHVERMDATAPAAGSTDMLAPPAAMTSPDAPAGETPKSAAAPARELAVAQVVSWRRMDGELRRTNVFAAKSFYVPPPMPRHALVKAPPPPPPAAPPLPFAYMGMLKEGGNTVVFVVNGEQLHSVRVGDVIDGAYRVETVGADEVTFVYLPMNERQTLRFGGSS